MGYRAAEPCHLLLTMVGSDFTGRPLVGVGVTRLVLIAIPVVIGRGHRLVGSVAYPTSISRTVVAGNFRCFNIAVHRRLTSLRRIRRSRVRSRRRVMRPGASVASIVADFRSCPTGA